MTRWKLLARNLRYFALPNLAVMAGVAVASAVLSGALLVGDSMRGSLRELADRRLGPVSHALMSPQFFPEDLADRLRAQLGDEPVAAGISLRGSARGSDSRASRLQLFAAERWVDIKPGEAIVSSPVANDLGTSAQMRITTSMAGAVPGESIMARRSSAEVTAGLRVSAKRLAKGEQFPGAFSLTTGQRPPRNVWMNLRELQGSIDQHGRVNMLLAGSADISPRHCEQLNSALRCVVELNDFGLSLRPGGNGESVLQSDSTYLPPYVEEAAQVAARQIGIPLRRVLVYLVNDVSYAARDSSIHYAVVAGVDELDGESIGDDEVIVNAWAANQLGAQIGDEIHLEYYQREPGGDLRQVKAPRPFHVSRIIPMAGLGAEPSLTPEYPGLTDAGSVADWDPPDGLHIDKAKVTPADEAYWDEHRAAPKLFVSLQTAQTLWGESFGRLTSIRIPADRADEFARALRQTIDPAQAGLFFRPVKSQQISAASGSTDFAGLFIGFSFFIIISAALLVAMLMRLNLEQRSPQFGLLAALGFEPRTIARLMLAEGVTIAIFGSALGTAGGLGYAWLMLAGLRSWWVNAIGTTALSLHVSANTLLIGFTAAVAIAVAAVLWTTRGITRLSAAGLLGGVDPAGPPQNQAAHVARGIGYTAIAAGALLILAGAADSTYAILGVAGGAALLVGVIVVTHACWLRPVARVPEKWSIGDLARRSAGRKRSRSTTTIALVAFASFVLVIVAAMKQQRPANTHDRASGTGGFQLTMQTDVPLTADLNSVAGRELLGVRRPDDAAWNSCRFVQFRRHAGDDVSCLNIARPISPTIIGVPQSLVERGGFAQDGNPRIALNGVEHDVVPMIADSETAQYILKLAIGDELPYVDPQGRGWRLKLVQTLSHSIFQGELLVSNADYKRMFPADSGYGLTLIEAPEEQLPAVRAMLNEELADFGPAIESTAELLVRFQQVANTYLSTFQTLGLLGLALGTLGLAVVLLRSLLERRRELAMLSAIGFTPALRLRLLISENLRLLVLGLLIGACCAIAVVLPSERAINLAQMAVTLAAVLVAGILTLLLAGWHGRRWITAADLRRE